MSETPMQIVLVEDNEGDVFLVRRALNQNSVPYEMRLARNGEDALRIVAENENGYGQRPDIFVLDLNLPRLGGGCWGRDAVVPAASGPSSLASRMPRIWGLVRYTVGHDDARDGCSP